VGTSPLLEASICALVYAPDPLARLPQAALECRALVEFGEVPLTDTARRLLAAAGWHTRPDTRPAVVAVLRDVWPEAIPAGWRTR
jgi:hypothetical protein